MSLNEKASEAFDCGSAGIHAPSPSSPILETEHLLVQMPDKTTFYSGPCFVAAALCSGRYQVVQEPYCAHAPLLVNQSQVVQAACERARLTIDGRLLWKGKRISPSAYVRLWRTLSLTPVSLQQLDAMGLRLVATMRAKLEPSRQLRSSWTPSPWKLFTQLEAQLGQNGRLDADADGYFTLEFDLSVADQPRRLFYATSMYAAQKNRDNHGLQVDIRFIRDNASQPAACAQQSHRTDEAGNLAEV